MEKERSSRLCYWVFAMTVFAGLALTGPALAAGGIDLEFLGKIDFTWDFCVGFLSIVLIDLVLAGDNAVVIALAGPLQHPVRFRLGRVRKGGEAVRLSLTNPREVQ
jgi:hypothetical protein